MSTIPIRVLAAAVIVLVLGIIGYTRLTDGEPTV